MRKTRKQILEWEAPRLIPAGVLTLLIVVLLIAGNAVGASISGDGNAEILRSSHEHTSAVLLSGILQTLAFALFVVPLFFLFRAVRARDSRVRNQLVGLVVVAPLFLAVSAGVNIAARGESADLFVAGNAKSTLTTAEAHEKCTSDEQSKGAKSFGEEFEASKGTTSLAACEQRKVEDDEASNAIGEVSLAGARVGFAVAGGLGLVVAFLYVGLWSMRTGLLGRFWASLAMALGFTVLVGFILFSMIWFVYLGLLLIGVLPGGRPPAWAAGEAVPWPTPGEKAAAELQPDPDLIDVDQVDPEDPPPPSGNGSGGDSRRRKRKRRG